MIDIRPATMGDVNYLAPRLRPADVQEIEAASGYPPDLALTLALARSRANVGTVDGRPIGIYGVMSNAPVGWVWMVATPELERHPRDFLRQSDDALAELARPWSFQRPVKMLQCWTDARNTVHHRWLRWCGFDYVKTAPWGVSGLPFLKYRKHV